jgi:HAD superfamily hydrolase (TIGR01549 family)
MFMLKAVMYDLDGTIIDSEKLHEHAWSDACQKMGIKMTKAELISQKGLSDQAVSQSLAHSSDPQDYLPIMEKKQAYAKEYARKIITFPDFINTLPLLRKKGIAIAIVTSSYKWYVDELLPTHPELANMLIVWREMTGKGKPDAEPLLFALRQLHIKPEEALYIGDAYNDYLCATAAKVQFIYYNPSKTTNPLIPPGTKELARHEDILRFF